MGGAGLLPGEDLRPILPQLIQRLRNSDPLAINEDNALDLMADEITGALIALMLNYGNLVMRIDTSQHLIFDKDQEQLRQPTEHRKSFQGIRRHVRDLRAAMRQLKLELRRV